MIPYAPSTGSSSFDDTAIWNTLGLKADKTMLDVKADISMLDVKAGLCHSCDAKRVYPSGTMS